MTRCKSGRTKNRRLRSELPYILLLSAFVLLMRIPALVFSEDLQSKLGINPDDFKPIATLANVKIDTAQVFPIANFVPLDTSMKLSLPKDFTLPKMETFDASKLNWDFTPISLNLANFNFKPSVYSEIFGSSTISLSNFSTSYTFSGFTTNKTFAALNSQLSYSFSSPIAQAKFTLPQVSSGSTSIKPATATLASVQPAVISNPSASDKSQSSQKTLAASKQPVITGVGQRGQDVSKPLQILPQAFQVNPAAAQSIEQATAKSGNSQDQAAGVVDAAPSAKVDNTGPANEFTFSSANPNKKDASKTTGSGVNPEMLQEVDMNVVLQQGAQPQSDNQAEARSSQYSAPMSGMKSDPGLQSPISTALLFFQDGRLDTSVSVLQPQHRVQELRLDGQLAKASKEQDKTIKPFLPQQGSSLMKDETQMSQNRVKLEINEAKETEMALPNAAEEKAEGAAPAPAENDLAYQSNPRVMMAKAMNVFRSDPLDLFGGTVSYQEIKKADLNDQDRAKPTDRGVKIQDAAVPAGPITALSAAFDPMRVSGSERFFTAFEVPPSRPIKEALNELVATARSFYRQAMDYWTQK